MPLVAPGPRGQPILGNYAHYRRDPLGFLLDLQARYGSLANFKIGPYNAHMVAAPDHIQHITADHYKRYEKSFTYKAVQKMTGLGLLTNDGDSWLRQRRLAQPAFHRKRLALLADHMATIAHTMISRWQPRSQIDMVEAMNHLTLQIVSQTLFSKKVDGQADAIAQAVTTAVHHTERRMTAPFDWIYRLPTPQNQRFKRAMQVLDRVVDEIIIERRQSGEDKPDLLAMLLEARDEGTNEGMNDRQLRDEVMTIFLAGHETTGNALAWAWYLIGQHPDVAEQLTAEVDRVIGTRMPTVDDLPHLVYTRQVIDETLRIYPPAWAFGRSPIEDDVIDGYHIVAGSNMLIAPYVTHRLPEFWPDPERFDPERFRPGVAEQRHKFAYIPFSAGPRLCIGNNFAIMEMQIVLATIVQHWHMVRVPGHSTRPDPLLTLRPIPSVPMTVMER